jgi:hypothetical protein
MPATAEPSLIPVIVGGLLAIAGGAVTTVLLHAMRTKTEKKNKRAEKYEELVAAIYEYDHWLDKRRDVRVFGEEGKLTPSPFAKMHAISTAYFPQFEDEIHELEIAVDQYELWMAKASQKRIAGEPPQSYAANFMDNYGPYLSKRHELLQALKEFAKREFQSDTSHMETFASSVSRSLDAFWRFCVGIAHRFRNRLPR